MVRGFQVPNLVMKFSREPFTYHDLHPCAHPRAKHMALFDVLEPVVAGAVGSSEPSGIPPEPHGPAPSAQL